MTKGAIQYKSYGVIEDTRGTVELNYLASSGDSLYEVDVDTLEIEIIGFEYCDEATAQQIAKEWFKANEREIYWEAL